MLVAMRDAVFPVLVLSAVASACAPAAPSASPAGNASPQQQIVDRATAAISEMRSNPDFRAMDGYLARAKGVMVFPRVIKAALIFGGEGGNGVLVARAPDGGWSAPAFYSMGAGSAGFQVGFQQASVVLFLMDESTLMSTMQTGLKLGSNATVAAGTIGDSGASRNATASRGVVEMTNVGGVFAGVSLDGAVIAPRRDFNAAYYGGDGTNAYDITVRTNYDRPGIAALKRALAPR